MEKKRYPFWYYLILIAIPFILIIVTEISLRIFNYGIDYSTFVVIEELSDQYYPNPDLTKKFFTNTTSIPSVIPDPFDRVKDDHTIRVFVFGGSTTAGYPYSQNASFPRIIKRKLEMFYPEYKIEVINLGVSAVNSHFIRNILPDVLKHEPDLLVFYAGHNEFYGALGPASTEYLFSNPTIVQFVLHLREFKVYQLVQNIMHGVVSTFSSDVKASRTTLMAEMIKEQEIPNDSEIYKSGLNQYKENMSTVLEQCNRSGIPVIVGNLVSNLKQKPLQLTEGTANKLFDDAQHLLSEGDTVRAKENYTEAKDNDLLKFRATEDFNDILEKLHANNDFRLVDIKTGFENSTQDNITGFNLMVDHLHPNLTGYKLMGELFYDEIDAVLSKKFTRFNGLSKTSVENYLSENFPFGGYDSTLAEIRINILLNDFPFKEKGKFDLSSIHLEDFEDSVAMQSITNGLGWAAAQLKIFDYYFERGNYKKSAKYLFILMEDRPFYKSALLYGIPKLLSKGLQSEAKHILVRNYKRYPDLFTSKNLGILNLNEGNATLANKLLLEAEGYQKNDPEIYFNLSRSYFAKNDLSNAIESMQKCLNISPNYPGAKNIYQKLMEMENPTQN